MILVTGGTGLLGSHLLLELVRKHEEVVALKRPSSGLEEVKRVFSYYSNEAEELFRLIDWVDADLMNYAEVERVMIDIDQVYHCAAMVSFRPRDRKKMINFNTECTTNIVNACIEMRVDKLLHVSSSSAIGKAPEGSPADESKIWARTKTSTSYSVSKFRSEMEVWRGIEEGLKAVIVNPTIILGPGFWDRGSSSMFGRVAGGMRYATPGVTGYVGVQDVVLAMTRLMASDVFGERYIVSSGDFSYREMLEMIAGALGKPRTLKPVSPSTLRFLSRVDAVAGFFTGKRRITGEQAKAAYHKARFSSQKVIEATGMEFTPVEKAIEHVAGYYRADHPRF
ncbi:MAG: NAD-dependent epimerase/dehydratase family protein [Bacteroidales bacterium]|nr:NAD-dependent epimerase/dehydratase family protein [Bacteroidales bacterium]